MCGIIGYIGDKEKKEVVLDGLRELEYRGYDSAGISILSNDTLSTFKTTGKLTNLEMKCKDFQSNGFGVAIGHTRWATHGKATEINAHPHYGEVSSVVHNGIIENFLEVKKQLESIGKKFLSQTDTEVIVHLFEENLSIYSNHLIAFKHTIDTLIGSYAILLITKSVPDKIFYAKNGSPLLIGSNGSEIYFASSSTPLIGIVDRICYLEDGDVGYMDINSFDNLKNIQPMSGEKISSQKDGYRYFMEKEIYEQHKILQDTIRGRILDDSINLEIPFDFIDGINRVVICACGTSHHAGLSAKYLYEREAKIKTDVFIASEFRYAEPILEKDSLFIVISQSGETADTLEALKLANKSGLKTLAICNVDSSSIVREAKYYLLTRAGVEKGVASTKAFSSQVILLWMLGIYMAQHKKTISNEKIKIQVDNIRNSLEATKVSSFMHDKLKKLSKRYLHGHGFFFIGRDIFYPLALEGALKLKEISYLHAEGYPGGEMKHGPIALADSELFCVSLMPKHLLYDKIKNNTQELSARDATICIIAQEYDEVADDMVFIDKFDSYMEEFFAMMIVLQILALEIAIRLGNDVDMPRNLAKSVTVE
ncbi:glutamine--fructose-6-phosphate transaminase (isomerizing) [Helicobacter sp. MIT 99-5507]|uniref:glutamine--fructose-6-phosphate transaminase (isomerizing) n=1 Tax=Helicobacter sp. MIT 99-5507 TaxID=152489 RepID=UPI000E1F3636|nr:glutamine--fructose-6-phosphate transaminase (isomerizing) [Helicobacter sp. MIT 99-5507]RDU58009.1 glutamine--fructose-6-phosphate transaminase (isomerizing) [Helicobacter sp. MIT 99-5507]